VKRKQCWGKRTGVKGRERREKRRRFSKKLLNQNNEVDHGKLKHIKRGDFTQRKTGRQKENGKNKNRGEKTSKKDEKP